MPGTEGGIASRPGPDKDEGGADTPAGRQLGLDSRDIPGGRPHLVNPESPATRPATTEPRPLFEGMNAHGVVDPDTGPGYTATPDDPRPVPAQRPVPVPKWHDAVPVYEVEGPKSRVIRTTTSVGPYTMPATDTGPHRICDRDPNRVSVYVTNENATAGNIIRIGTRAEVDQSVGFGLAGNRSTSPDLKSQDELYVWNPTGTAITYSAILVTEIEASGL